VTNRIGINQSMLTFFSKAFAVLLGAWELHGQDGDPELP
jgi:hypothetical protein